MTRGSARGSAAGRCAPTALARPRARRSGPGPRRRTRRTPWRRTRADAPRWCASKRWWRAAGHDATPGTVAGAARAPFTSAPGAPKGSRSENSWSSSVVSRQERDSGMRAPLHSRPWTDGGSHSASRRAELSDRLVLAQRVPVDCEPHARRGRSRHRPDLGGAATSARGRCRAAANRPARRCDLIPYSRSAANRRLAASQRTRHRLHDRRGVSGEEGGSGERGGAMLAARDVQRSAVAWLMIAAAACGRNEIAVRSVSTASL